MKIKRILMPLASTLLVCCSLSYAQDSTRDGGQSADPNAPVSSLPPQDSTDNGNRQTPVPTARGLFLGSDSPNQNDIDPDNHALTSGATMGLGSLNRKQRTFDPSFRLGQFFDSGLVPGQKSGATSLGGSLVFGQYERQSQLVVFYDGGASFYYPNSSFTQTYHTFSVAQDILVNRWILRFRNDLSISPQATFGGLYTGTASSTVQNDPLTTLSPVISAGQTILTGNADRLNDTALGEVDLQLSRGTTLTMTASYGWLHFLDPGYLDSHNINGGFGYNHAINRNNSLALSYNYGSTTFSGGHGVNRTHLIQGAFGRKITGRLAFQIAAGPQLVQLRNYGSANGQHWSWSLSTALNYQLTRLTSAALSYYHGVTNGSGVFAGSNSDNITVIFTHGFTRFWSAQVDGGYSRNTTLATTASTTSFFSNWWGGATTSHQFGRQINVSANYGLQRQTNNSGVCPVLSCGPTTGLHHVVNVNLEWHPFAIPAR